MPILPATPCHPEQTFHDDIIQCPHCHRFINDAFEYTAGLHHCPYCDGAFDLEAEVSVTYTATARSTKEAPA